MLSRRELRQQTQHSLRERSPRGRGCTRGDARRGILIEKPLTPMHCERSRRNLGHYKKQVRGCQGKLRALRCVMVTAWL